MSPLNIPAWRSILNIPSSRSIFVIASTSLLATITFNENLVEVGSIQGESMTPSISPEYGETGRRDFVVWKKWQPLGNLQRGDVVLFMNPRRPDSVTVKRIIGMEGDTVLLDPRRRPRESHEAQGWDVWMGRVRVPYGHVWVEGDNWRSSLDSNHYGPISQSLIIGRAVSIIWPWGRFRTKPWEGFKVKTKVIPGPTKMNVPPEWAD